MVRVFWANHGTKLNKTQCNLRLFSTLIENGSKMLTILFGVFKTLESHTGHVVYAAGELFGQLLFFLFLAALFILWKKVINKV